jgi:hypothetical protein
LKTQAPQIPETSRFVSELASRQIRHFPQHSQGTPGSPIKAAF